jgi:peptide/nickel transport system substrate-binding protein
VVLALVVAGSCVVAILLYWLASARSNVAAVAVRNAETIQRVERAVGLDRFDEPLRRSLGDGASGAVVAWIYAFGYWPFLAAALGVTAWRRRAVFWRLSAAGASSGLIGVVVIVAFPTAPPRLTGFTDVVQQSPWGSVAHPDSLMNPYGAMPSFHVAWSLLAAVALTSVVRTPWARGFVVVQPLAMMVAVVASANHWWLDVLAGALLAALAWAWLSPALVKLVADARLRDAARGRRTRPPDVAGAALSTNKCSSVLARDDARGKSMKTRRRALWRVLAASLVVVMVAAACGDDGGDSDDGAPSGDGATTTEAGAGDAGEPQSGGVITVGQFSSPPGLAPYVLQGGGTVGGNENGALYDTLLRYNVETEEYEPRTAESMEPNEDYSVWTMKLRDGIKFADGTAYDAEAVKFVLEYQMANGAASPKGQMLEFLNPQTSITVVDPLTLRFELKQPWVGFPYIFVGVAGMIYSPTAFQAAGSPQAFAANPVNAGAGPFLLKTFRPNDVIELERNPNYWGGDVHLDGLRFILLPGAAATYEGLQADTLQAAFVRDAEVIAEAKDADFGSVDMPAICGNLGIMNSASGATKSLTVRQAVAHAVDPEVVNERVYGGAAVANSAPFANSPWDPGVEGPEADIDEARRLVEQAKREGWDGKIRVLAGNDPVSSSWAQAVSTLLQQAGMETQVDSSQPIQGVVAKVLVERDYDIATWGLGWLDEHDVNYLQLVGSFSAEAPRYGYTSPDMVDAIDMLRTAVTDEEKEEAYRAVSEVWVRDVPGHCIALIPQAMLHVPGVHGLVRTGQSTTLFHEAWLEQ